MNGQTAGRAITEYLAQELGSPVRLYALRSSTLRGSGVSPKVVRLDAVVLTADGRAERRSFVRKHTDRLEIDVMRLLAPIARLRAIPALIADGRDYDGRWLLLPFLAGDTLPGQSALPDDVCSTLAEVHTRFARRLEDLAFLPRCDEQYWQCLLDGAQRSLAQVDWQPHSLAEVEDCLAELRRSAAIPRAQAWLPPTLIHGDVHGGNMVRDIVDGRTHLFDWGNARLGPAAIDLANCIDSPDSPSWSDYWHRVAAISGAAPSRCMKWVSYLTGTAVVNMQYLPHAIAQLGPQRALSMAHRAHQAATTLGTAAAALRGVALSTANGACGRSRC